MERSKSSGNGKEGGKSIRRSDLTLKETRQKRFKGGNVGSCLKI